MMRGTLIFSGRVTVGMLLACLVVGGLMAMGPSQRVPQISIEGQEGTLSPSMVGVASLFLKIVNSGNGDDNLLSAKVNIPNTLTELHDVKDGKMVKTEKIRIPSGSSVELRPRGLHIMVFKLPKDVREGQEVTLSLTFERSGEKLVSVRFIKTPGSQMHHNH